MNIFKKQFESLAPDQKSPMYSRTHLVSILLGSTIRVVKDEARHSKAELSLIKLEFELNYNWAFHIEHPSNTLTVQLLI